MIEQYKIGSDIGEERGSHDAFQDAVEEPGLSQENINAARRETELLHMERDDQRLTAKPIVGEEVDTMMKDVYGQIQNQK